MGWISDQRKASSWNVSILWSGLVCCIIVARTLSTLHERYLYCYFCYYSTTATTLFTAHPLIHPSYGQSTADTLLLLIHHQHIASSHTSLTHHFFATHQGKHYHGVRITGATGTNSDLINGWYEPSEEMSGGMCVYVKVGDNDTCLEYNDKLKKWQVKPVDCKVSIYAFLLALA